MEFVNQAQVPNALFWFNPSFIYQYSSKFLYVCSKIFNETHPFSLPQNFLSILYILKYYQFCDKLSLISDSV